MIIAFTGYLQSGKDTAADYLLARNKSFKKYSLAQPLKEAAKIMFGFTDDQVYGVGKDVIDSRYGIKPREVLQTLGTEYAQKTLPTMFPEFEKTIGRNLWVSRFLEMRPDNCVLSDLRFPHEADAVKSIGGYVIRVLRPDKVPHSKDLHESEKYIQELEVDSEIINDGSLVDFYEKIEFVLKHLGVVAI